MSNLITLTPNGDTTVENAPDYNPSNVVAGHDFGAEFEGQKAYMGSANMVLERPTEPGIDALLRAMNLDPESDFCQLHPKHPTTGEDLTGLHMSFWKHRPFGSLEEWQYTACQGVGVSTSYSGTGLATARALDEQFEQMFGQRITWDTFATMDGLGSWVLQADLGSFEVAPGDEMFNRLVLLDSPTGKRMASLIPTQGRPFCANMFAHLQKSQGIAVRHTGNDEVTAQQKLNALASGLAGIVRDFEDLAPKMQEFRRRRMTSEQFEAFRNELYPLVRDTNGREIPISEPENRAIAKQRDALTEALHTRDQEAIQQGMPEGLGSANCTWFGAFNAATYVATHGAEVRIKGQVEINDGGRLRKVKASVARELGHGAMLDDMAQGRRYMNMLTGAGKGAQLGELALPIVERMALAA